VVVVEFIEGVLFKVNGFSSVGWGWGLVGGLKPLFLGLERI
jgi:hypothetical protein